LKRVYEKLTEIGDSVLIRLRRYHPVEAKSKLRLTIAHFGDDGAAFRRLAQGGAEIYYAEKYSVEFVASLAARNDMESLTAINLLSNAPAESLPSRVQTLGIELYPQGQRPRYRALIEAVRKTNPTHLIVMSPITPLIRWGLRARIPVLPMFADSFLTTGPKAALDHRLLALLLNHPSIELVGNHNLAASLDLKRIGVDPLKIVPYDWPALISPQDYSAKSAPPQNRPFRLIYVGSLVETKGVGDAIKAIAIVCKSNRPAELTIIGRGGVDNLKRLAISEGVEEHVHLLGPKSHSEVLAAMRDHDAVVVPSHWTYPEGLPMTIYEALCTRTPLLTSDHPMFALKIRDGHNALVFRERTPKHFAEKIIGLASSPDLYTQLSAASEEAAAGYLCPLKYDHLVSGFLSPTTRIELKRYSLNNYCYF
jgi:glycosyltransferase involved in cell wall biosynthesis